MAIAVRAGRPAVMFRDTWRSFDMTNAVEV